MGNLITLATQAYDTYKATMPTSIADWDKATDAEIAALFREEMKYKQAIEDARLIEESFYEARSAAFTAFEAAKQSEFVALQNLWQSKEDADYDVDYGDE